MATDRACEHRSFPESTFDTNGLAECINRTREYENPFSGVEVWRGA